MRGKTACFLLALILTAGLALLLPWAVQPRTQREGVKPLVRIWTADPDPAVSAWLREQAADWEKQTGRRVYLRQASEADKQAALNGEAEAGRPDLMLLADEGRPVALRGYALILRDDAAPTAAPAPTGLLFSRPTPVPAADPTPAPTPDWAGIQAVLSPKCLAGRAARAVESADPAGDLIRGRAQAALLTAEQAARLPFGFRAFSLPEGAGFIPVGAAAFTADGEAFLQFLLTDGAQRALRARGLYSPALLLYGPDDPVRDLIQRGRPLPSE